MIVPFLSVLMPTYRQPETLLLTLRDLEKQDYPEHAWELIVVDDGGGDSSSQLVFQFFQGSIPVTVKRLPEGGYYEHSSLFNELIRLSSPSTSAYVHVEDVRVRSDYLRQHAKWHTTEQIHLVTGPMCEGHAETFEPSACSRWPVISMHGSSSTAYECCFQAIFAKSMSYPSQLVATLSDHRSMNPFDDQMSGWGYHEVEFALRASKVDAMCVYDTECAVFHPAHQNRDELEYRHVQRKNFIASGEQQNIEYLCGKHGLNWLPNWEGGKPVRPRPHLTILNPDSDEG